MEKDCRVRLQGAGNDFLQNVTCFGCGEKGHFKDKCPKAGNQQNDGARGRAYVVVENPQQNPNVVTGTFLLNDHYACILFDSGAEKSFVSSAFTHFINIAPATLNTSYEVELADGKVISTNTILRSCTLVLLNHVFKIDLLPTGLGKRVVIIGMDLVAYHRLSSFDDENKLDDIRVVRRPSLRSPYRLAPSEMLECQNQLKELQETGFIRPSHHHGEQLCSLSRRSRLDGKCIGLQSPVLWAEVGESQLIGPEIVPESTEMIVKSRDMIKDGRCRRKAMLIRGVNLLNSKLETELLLKVSPWKGVELSLCSRTRFTRCQTSRNVGRARCKEPLDEIEVDDILLLLKNS
ncbi:putative reverse transcriptase domain-containing protein [Tanacetum coccineum]